MLETPDGTGPGNSSRHHLLNPGIANADQRKLGSHEERVDQDQHAYGDELQQWQTVHLACEDSIDSWGENRNGLGTNPARGA